MCAAVRRHPKGGIRTHPLPAPPPKELHTCAAPSESLPKELHVYTVVRRHPKGGICTHPLPAPPPKESPTCAVPSVSLPKELFMYTAVRRHPKGGICTHPLPAPPPKELHTCAAPSEGIEYVHKSASPPQGRHMYAPSPCAAPKGVAYARSSFCVAPEEIVYVHSSASPPRGRNMCAPSPCTAPQRSCIRAQLILRRFQRNCIYTQKCVATPRAAYVRNPINSIELDPTSE